MKSHEKLPLQYYCVQRIDIICIVRRRSAAINNNNNTIITIDNYLDVYTIQRYNLRCK